MKRLTTFLLDAYLYFYKYPRYVWGLYRIYRLQGPIVTVFGGKGASQDSRYYQQAFSFAGLLAKQEYSVLSGGGPGIMEAALCGAVAEGKRHRALGIGVSSVDVDFVSACKHETVFLDDFAARKLLLIRYSVAFVCFPGGIGTLDELLEVLNLIKTNKLARIPVVLIGKNYWKHILAWIEHAVAQNFITQDCAGLIVVTDDVHEAIAIVNRKRTTKS